MPPKEAQPQNQAVTGYQFSYSASSSLISPQYRLFGSPHLPQAPLKETTGIRLSWAPLEAVLLSLCFHPLPSVNASQIKMTNTASYHLPFLTLTQPVPVCLHPGSAPHFHHPLSLLPRLRPRFCTLCSRILLRSGVRRLPGQP
ncbi:MAG: hypothetical protein A4E62_01478 [Syntrophorhabdus sp. PtaU1.Bin002]|nr:MAG: hypothetical protein A4E62_01478 [Syntrophorhabdus sp. PtaU1.Bin002]